jgi:hypothetical protein
MKQELKKRGDPFKLLKSITEDVERYLRTKDDTYAYWAAAGMNDLFGHEFAAHVFFRELTSQTQK